MVEGEVDMFLSIRVTEFLAGGSQEKGGLLGAKAERNAIVGGGESLGGTGLVVEGQWDCGLWLRVEMVDDVRRLWIVVERASFAENC